MNGVLGLNSVITVCPENIVARPSYEPVIVTYHESFDDKLMYYISSEKPSLYNRSVLTPPNLS